MWLDKINNSSTLAELEEIRIEIFGKKGILAVEFAKMKDVPNEQKKSLHKI